MNANISQFLEKLKSNLFSEDSFRDEVCSVILERTKFPLEKNSVRETKGIITLRVDPYMKTEVMLRKNDILEALRSKYPKRIIRDIM